jgi:Ca2+-binding RTX toxin-like protein
VTIPATHSGALHPRRVRPRRRWTVATPAIAAALAFGAGVQNAAAGATPVKAGVRKSVLTVTGTPGADVIVLRLQAGTPGKLVVDVGGDGSAEFVFDRQSFHTIVVEGGAADDTLVADRSAGTFTDTERTTLSGGDGRDTLVGEVGAELLTGGGGDDILDGNQGADTLSGGDGTDISTWDPGDASDTIDGGPGPDRVVFNGSAASENVAVTAAADHARVTRDVGAVVLDLTGVEALDHRAQGGTDTITVTDVSATALDNVTTDLSLNGTDDAQVDTVVVPVGSRLGQDATTAVVDVAGTTVRAVNGAATDAIRVTGTTTADTVSIVGTANADTVTAFADTTDVAIVGATGTMTARFSAVETIDIDLAGGNDTFAAAGNLAPLTTLDVDGGDGHDTLLGGNGPDRLTGSSGDDTLDGNQGADTLSGGDGTDIITWDPGDASDTIDGGPGPDRVVFNGSAIGEAFVLSAVGDHLSAARNIGNVVLDIDGVERVALRTLAGSDSVTVDDLSATDVAELSADLAAATASPDLLADTVTVNGTPGDDHVAVVDEGTAVDVQGLMTTVRVFGADASLDVLVVDGRDGVDEISATPGALALMLITLLP